MILVIFWKKKKNISKVNATRSLETSGEDRIIIISYAPDLQPSIFVRYTFL